MEQFIKKDFLISCLKKFIQVLKRVKKFICEAPPGYTEYLNAILSKDKNFNYLENEYFKNHILPQMKHHHCFDTMNNSSINHQELFNRASMEQFRVNPVTGLPMIGSYDAGGNPYGFDYNRSMHNPFNSHSGFNPINSSSSFNSFDYWK